MRTCMLLNQKGTSLVIMLIVTAVIGLSAVTIMTLGSQKRKMTQQMNVSVSAKLVKQKLVGIILSPQSWQLTQTKNSAAFADFTPGGPTPMLNIYTPASSLPYYEPTNSRAGFDLNGNPCFTFTALGDDKCPLRYNITLKNRDFQNGNWIDTLHFDLSFKPHSPMLALNTSSNEFTFDLVRNLNDLSVEAACQSISGIYNASTNSCSTKITTSVTACGSGRTYRGPAMNVSQTNCDSKAIPTTACVGSQVVKGFTVYGVPICGVPL